MTQRDLHTIGFTVLGAALSAAVVLGGRPSATVELIVLGVLVVIAGVPHGALDPVVARRAGLVTDRASSARFLGGYTLIAAAAATFWLALPEVGLIAFLLMSGWHFAGDWPELDRITRGLAGAFVIGGPLLFHADEVAELFGALSSDAFAASAGEAVRPVVAAGAIALAASLVRELARHRLRAVELLTLGLLAWVLPPLLFFVAYFCVLHSPRHIAGVLRDWAVPHRVAVRVGAAFTALTLLGVAPAVLVLDGPASDQTVRIVFIALGSLTVPHMITTRLASRSSCIASVSDTKAIQLP